VRGAGSNPRPYRDYGYYCTPIIRACQGIFLWYSIGMARLIVVLLLLTLIGANQAPPTGNENEKTEDARANKGSAWQKPNEAPPTVVQKQTIHSELSEQKGQDQTAYTAKPSHDWIDRLNAFSTVAIAFFTAFLFWGVIRQISTSRDTERAWISISPMEAAPILGFIPKPGDPLNEPGRDKTNSFACSIKNTGNTPARLVESALKYRKIDSLKNVPDEPDYSEALSYDDLLLVKGDSTGILTSLYPEVVLKQPELAAVKTKTAFLYAFGRVVYKDVYDRQHEARFGYVYHIPHGGDPRPLGFAREGLPREYNKAT
jgi:hypothetical protein